MTQVVQFTSEAAELGECPLWSQSDNALYWFDVPNRRLFRQSGADAKPISSSLEKIPGCFGFRANGGAIFAFRNGLALGDRPEGPFEAIAADGIDFRNERFNDGKVDRRGRFWAGTFHPKMEPGRGSLYRIDPDLTLHRMDTGISMSNGIGWSPDDRVMYYADSRPGNIWCYDFDLAKGEIKNRRAFVDYAGKEGRPDGLTVDAEGFVWVAEVTASRVARYAPDGALDRVVTLPISRPTSVIFGGADYRTLFITSMRLGLDHQQTAEPLAGLVFSVDAKVQGRPEPLFAG